jgi:hypothetical protein
MSYDIDSLRCARSLNQASITARRSIIIETNLTSDRKSLRDWLLAPENVLQIAKADLQSIDEDFVEEMPCYEGISAWVWSASEPSHTAFHRV